MCLSCHEEKSFDWDALAQHDKLKTIFEYKDKHELQIRYTQIDRDENQIPRFTSFDFNVDSTAYFYPASTVKMPIAFLAIQRINEIREKGVPISIHTRMEHDSIRPPQSPARIDSTSPSGYPSIAHYINKLFVVSDNDAYNRLYEFVGQDYINKELQKREIFSNSRIVTRVGISGFNSKANRYTNPVKFLDETGKTILLQRERLASDNYIQPLSKAFKGKGYYDEDLDSTVMKMFNMYEKNFVNIYDLEAALQRVIFPDAFPESKQFGLLPKDYAYLYRAMNRLPKDMEYLKENPDMNYDSYVKFFMFGDSKDPIPEHIHLFNKVGFAYGTLTDCAYIFDTKHNVEFFLTATLLVNDNEIFNDGQYEYDDIGIPFLAELGRQIYQLELVRERKLAPDFRAFGIKK